MSAPAPFRRRGACPALSSPMETGDGLLVRLMPEGGLSPDTLRGLAAAAAEYGNGVLEVTARGSLQLRGLRPETVGPLNTAVTALAIRAREGLAIDLSPLSGLDATELGDARALADALRREIRQAGFAPRLGPKVSIVIDSGGAIPLDTLKADMRLRAEDGGWHMAIAGDAASARNLGHRTAEDAVRETVALLARLAERGPTARMRALTDTARGIPSPATRASASPGALLSLRDGRVALPLALPFGAMMHDQLTRLADAAARHGAADVRPAPPRLLLIVGLAANAATAFRREAETLGFICRPDDPRLFVVACPGAPACASGHLPARALAPDIASALAPVLDAEHILHLSGCDKGCAHPAPAYLTLTGRSVEGSMDSAAALVRHGTPSAPAAGTLPVIGLPARLAAAARLSGGDADDLVNRLLAGASLEQDA